MTLIDLRFAANRVSPGPPPPHCSDALVFPGTLAASLHTGVRVPVALEAIVLAIATVIPAIGHFGHLVDMSHDRFHDYLRAEGLPNHAPNAWAYFVVPLLAAMWITVYWMIR